VRGTRSLAEIGHTVIDWRAWRDGRPGTLEELGSGSGLARLARDTGLGELDARMLHEAALAGDGGASALWRDAIAACAAGVSSLVLSFYPSLVVVGGGLGLQPEFFAPLRDLVLSHPEHHPEDLRVLPAALGDDGALAGAAAWLTALDLA
jgi:predicted NBD/HSP70 family sugar kinase